jgi:hypothetical protein
LPLEGPTTVSFSPNGRWLATFHASGTQLWEVGTWRPGRRFEGAPVFSPDSRLIALGGSFGVVRLLETDTGKEVARLTGTEATWYTPCCFTPDGTKLIATSSDEKALHVWNLRAIREQLKGLDWGWPDFSPADPKADASKLVSFEVVSRDLKLTREEKARRSIERYLSEVKAKPDNPRSCNSLAWVYLTAPPALRDVKAALTLAKNAVRLDAANAHYRNTLGVAYYRNAQYREAVETLRPNLDKQDDNALAFDLYFLAMSHHRLGETTRARDYLAWGARWTAAQRGLSAAHLEELKMFRAEAEELLGIETK